MLATAGILLAMETAAPVGPAPGAVVLVDGAPVVRDLPRRGEHRYGIALEAGDFVRIVIEQQREDVTAEMHAPDDRELAGYDEQVGSGGEEQVDFVADLRGTYTLAVKPAPGIAGAARYRVRLVLRRPATRIERAG